MEERKSEEGMIEELKEENKKLREERNDLQEQVKKLVNEFDKKRGNVKKYKKKINFPFILFCLFIHPFEEYFVMLTNLCFLLSSFLLHTSSYQLKLILSFLLKFLTISFL